MKVKTEKIELKKGSIVFLKTWNFEEEAEVLQIIITNQGTEHEKVVLKVVFSNGIKHYCYLEEIEKIIK